MVHDTVHIFFKELKKFVCQDRKLKFSTSVWFRISWNLAKFQLIWTNIQTIFFYGEQKFSEWAQILLGFTKWYIKEMLKISAFYLDKQFFFNSLKKYELYHVPWTNKNVLFQKKLSVPCTMDSSFFSQKMAPWCPNFPHQRLSS